jgi:hypothetical protein
MTWECIYEQTINVPAGKYSIYSFSCDCQTGITKIYMDIMSWLTTNHVFNITDMFIINQSGVTAYMLVVKIPMLYKLAFEDFSSTLPQP